jgi:hypothetical protein
MPIDNELATDNWLRYVYVRDNGHLDYVQKANKCDDFFLGKQWDPLVKQRLDTEQRPALTINKILSTLSNVMGDQIQTRADTTFKPLHSEGEDLSHEIEQLYKQMQIQTDLLWKESEVFADGAITSRGFYDVRLGFKDNTQGEIEIYVPNPRNVLIDPDAEQYDPDTWKEVIYTKWLAPNDIAVLYNQEDADYLAMNNTNPYIADIDSIQRSYDRFGQEGHYFTDNQVARDILRNIRVVERQYKKLTKQKFFVDVRTGDQRAVPPEWTRDRIGFVAEQYGLGVIERLAERIRWTTSAGAVVLHDDWSPYRHFTIIPFFPYFRRGRTMGLVENLLDPQELLNKTSSQELHIVNTTANSGWIMKQNALRNMTVEELEQRGAQSGVVLEVDDIKNIEKIQPNQIPTGIERISYKAEEHIKTISNIDDNALGQDREDVAAKAIKAKRQRGSVNQMKVMENLNFTRKILARNVLDIIQEYYTEPRIYRITFDNPVAEAGANEDDDEGKFLEFNQYQEVTGEITSDLSLGKYDVMITSMPARDTLDESEFEQAVAMRMELGIPIPDDVILSHSLLRNKREIIRQLKQQQSSPEAQERAALERQGMANEVAKTGAEVEKVQADAMLKTASAQEKIANVRTAETTGKTGGDGGKMMAEVMKARAAAQAQQSSQEHDANMKGSDQQFEREMQGTTQQHEAGMLAAEHASAMQQKDADSKIAEKQAETAAKNQAKQTAADQKGAMALAKAKPKPKPAAKK